MRIAIGAIALAFALGLNAAPAQAAGAEAYVPASAAGMVVWQNPKETLSRIETLMAVSGMAPPGQQAGWLEAQMTEQDPRLKAIDLSKPVYVALVPAGSEGLKGVAVLHRKAKDETKIESKPDEPFRMVAKKDVVLMIQAGLAKSYESPAKKAYSIDGMAKQFKADNDLFAHFDSAKLSQVLDALGGEAKDMKRVLEETTSVALATQLGTQGLFARWMSQYDPKSKSGKQIASLENTEAPLIHSLPRQNYVFVMGGLFGSAETMEMALDETITQIIEAATAEEPGQKTLTDQIGKLRGVFKGKFQDDQKIAMGMAMPGDPATVNLVGWLSGSAKKTQALVTGMAEWMNETIGVMSKEMDQEIPMALKKSEPQKVKSTQLEGWQIDLKEELPPDMTPAQKAMVTAPLRYGAVGKNTVMAWNTPTPVLTELVSGGTKDLLATPKFARTRQQLDKSRFAEMYLDVGPIIAAFAAEQNPMMATSLKAILSTLPSFGATAEKIGNGARFDLFVPVEVAQVAGGVGAMLQQ